MLRIPTTVVMLLAAALAVAAGAERPQAAPLSGSWRLQNPARLVTIGYNPGGYVVDFAMQLEQWRKSATRVRFAGPCLSACTLYLALPTSQTCITPDVSFTFHAPHGPSTRANHFAKIYMNNTYPRWVQSWIRSRGGLTHRPVNMEFAYAKKFMRTCDTVTAGQKPRKVRQAG